MLWIFCEGEGDKAFFEELIKIRRLSPATVKVVGGKDNYANKLKNDITEITKARPERILFTADNDETPTASFEAVCSAVSHLNDEIKKTGSSMEIPIPRKSKSWTGRGTKSAIYMMPASGTKGALESLLLKYLASYWTDYQQCTNAFVQCIEAQRRNDLDKLKLRLFLCAITKDPNVGIGYLWSEKKWEKPTDKIDLNDPIFDGIANFLKKVAA